MNRLLVRLDEQSLAARVADPNKRNRSEFIRQSNSQSDPPGRVRRDASGLPQKSRIRQRTPTTGPPPRP